MLLKNYIFLLKEKQDLSKQNQNQNQSVKIIIYINDVEHIYYYRIK